MYVCVCVCDLEHVYVRANACVHMSGAAGFPAPLNSDITKPPHVGPSPVTLGHRLCSRVMDAPATAPSAACFLILAWGLVGETDLCPPFRLRSPGGGRGG